MQRLTLLILLLTVVYSWEQFKYVIVVIWSKISKRNKNYPQNPETDILVSDLVLIATVPISLAYLIMGQSNLPVKLLVLLVEFIVVGLVLKGIQEYFWRRNFTRHYEGFDKVVALGFSLLGLVSPSLRVAQDVYRVSPRPGKYLRALILPLAAGLVLAIAVHKLGPEEFNSHLDELIAIAILGLVLNVTIDFLQKLFRSNRFHLDSLLRVVLGIVIIFVLTASI